MPAAETRETLAGIVERHAQRRPDAIAIRYGERQWSWAEWSSRIRRGALRGAGIQRGQCVAFLDKNHPACLEVLIGGASVGAVTTVVNWRVIRGTHVLRAASGGRGGRPSGAEPGTHHRGR